MESKPFFRGHRTWPWRAAALAVTLGLSACAVTDTKRGGSEAAAPAPRTQSGPATPVDPRMQQLQARMEEMHKLMHRIEDARDADERQRLQRQQAQLMQENLQLMVPLMMSIIHRGMGQGEGGGMRQDGEAHPGRGEGGSGEQGGPAILVPAPSPTPLPEEPILEEAPQRNS